MNEKIDLKDRDVILKLVTASVCVLELFITICTMLYQKDVVRRMETPITEEMAQIYINHPEQLKPNERLALNVYNERNNQRSYLIVKNEKEVIPFPWKAWILISVGFPIGIAFIILLLTRAYMQVVEQTEKESEDSANSFASSLNKLSQINVIWFMLLSVVVLFLLWYIPEILKYTGDIAITWLIKYWWVPTTVFFVVVMIVLVIIYLQYRLKLKALDTEMEITKFKLLQFQDSHPLLLEQRTGQTPPMIKETLNKNASD
jgi:uncharacterized membrane-anchored protein YhcB (DUF1043 family)